MQRDQSIHQRFQGKRVQLRNVYEEAPIQNQQKVLPKISQTTQFVLDLDTIKSSRQQILEQLRNLNKLNTQHNIANKKISTAQKFMEIKYLHKLIELLRRYQIVLLKQQALTNINSFSFSKQFKDKQIELNHMLKQDFQQQKFQIKSMQLKQNSYFYYQEVNKNIQSFAKEKDKLLQQKNKDSEKSYNKKVNTLTQLHKQRINSQKQSKQAYENKKKDNNLVQQERGNVRVYCRLRPCFKEDLKIDLEVNDSVIKLRRNKADLKSKNIATQFEYVFEKVFNQDINQQEIFQELSQLVQCSLDGKNVCIFAYGQTGSGKTYTMKGSLQYSTWHLRGFIPRSIQYIFNEVKIAKSKGYSYKISVAISQIYNDKLIDLLLQKQDLRYRSNSKSSSKSNNSYNSQSSSKKRFSNYNQKSQSSLFNLTYSEITDFKSAIFLLTDALSRRATANTQMNAQSSRSHLIFEIKNQFQNIDVKNTKRSSSLVLVDLAGSERQKDSCVTGARFQEAKQINKSLTELGKVMRAIKEQQPPSFRSSKLTTVLQRHLQGDSKAVMFVNVSTDQKDLQQSAQSLSFAQSVRQCQLKNSRRISSARI